MQHPPFQIGMATLMAAVEDELGGGVLEKRTDS